jgi:DNA-binding NarL/FixJ family response regulator
VNRPRLVMADDHTLVLEGLRRLIEPRFNLVGTAEDGQTLVDLAASVKPDAVLLDISMPVLNGFDAARKILKILPKVKLIFVTMHSEPAYVAEALRLGAAGYVLKRSAVSELNEAISHALSGRRYVTPLVAGVKLPVEAKRAPERAGSALTARERQVLQLVAEGRSAKEMAWVLKVSTKTIEFHKKGIMEKLGVRTVAELTRHAIREKLIDA